MFYENSSHHQGLKKTAALKIFKWIIICLISLLFMPVAFAEQPVFNAVAPTVSTTSSQTNLATEKPLTNVTLQLKWLHQFQFAGYYAAKHQGYYREAGLDVEIKAAQQGVDAVQQVVFGEADFGVGTSELLLLRAKQQPVVVLAVIFQHSPLALMYRADKNINSIHDIVSKKVMVEHGSAEIFAYLNREGIAEKDIEIVEHTFNPQQLINDEVDLMTVYSTTEPFRLEKANIPYHLFSPRAAGIDFYGDNLFTTEDYIKQHPQQVKAFLEASLKGWVYAMAHPDEMIELIVSDYNPKLSREFLQFEYQQMLPLLQPTLVEMGYMHKGRWQHIAETYRSLSMLPNHFSLEGFLYQKNPQLDLRYFYWGITILSSGFLLFWGLSIHRARLNKRLRQEIKLEIDKSQQQRQLFIQKLEQANKELESQVISRTASLNNTLEKLQTLLDHSGEGFLAFNEQLLIDEGYSHECTKIFNQELTGKNIGLLLFSNQSKQQQLFKENIHRILVETDDFKQGLFLSLLPAQFKIAEKIINATYKLIANRSIMLKLTDVTQEEALKQQLIAEKKRLVFIVEVVSEPKEFFDLCDDYQNFIQNEYIAILENNSSVAEKLNLLYRQVHTFKGVFLQKALLYTPEALHRVENDLSLLKDSEGGHVEKLKRLFEKQNLFEFFQQDLDCLKAALGENYIEKQGQIQISDALLKENIRYAEQLIDKASLSAHDISQLIRKLQHLRYVDIKNLLGIYPKVCIQLAARLDKELAPFTVEGESILVDPDYFAEFNKALIHLFRNILAHGIELPEDRELQNKTKAGHIFCRVNRQKNIILIQIGDDGAGINVEKLKQKAFQLGHYSREQLDSFSQQQNLNLIFDAGLSTQPQADLVSGQGMGLAALKSELDKLDATVIVTSELGEGTRFDFKIPYSD